MVNQLTENSTTVFVHSLCVTHGFEVERAKKTQRAINYGICDTITNLPSPVENAKITDPKERVQRAQDEDIVPRVNHDGWSVLRNATFNIYTLLMRPTNVRPPARSETIPAILGAMVDMRLALVLPLDVLPRILRFAPPSPFDVAKTDASIVAVFC